MVEQNFTYTSNNNENWMNVETLKKWIETLIW